MIAVCVPAYNLIEYTRWAIESVVKHSAPHDVRLYLLDNGSERRNVFDYMKSIPKAKVVRNDINRWVYGGWNQLFEMAMADKPDLVVLMSNDVQVGRNWLDGIVRGLAGDRKKFFMPIPITLRLWYGDDWIHWKLKGAGYKCETVLDSCAIHFGSKTLEIMNQEEKVRIIAQDKVEYERLTGEKMQ